jgi:hypothetical protein
VSAVKPNTIGGPVKRSNSADMTTSRFIAAMSL